MDTQPSATVQIMTVDVRAAKDLIGCGYRYLDVRTEEEFKNGHLDVKDGLNIPYMFHTAQGRVKNLKFMEQVLSVCNKDNPLIVDFKHAYNMRGGYLAWVGNGYATTKPDQPQPNKLSNN